VSGRIKWVQHSSWATLQQRQRERRCHRSGESPIRSQAFSHTHHILQTLRSCTNVPAISASQLQSPSSVVRGASRSSTLSTCLWGRRSRSLWVSRVLVSYTVHLMRVGAEIHAQTLSLEGFDPLYLGRRAAGRGRTAAPRRRSCMPGDGVVGDAKSVGARVIGQNSGGITKSNCVFITAVPNATVTRRLASFFFYRFIEIHSWKAEAHGGQCRARGRAASRAVEQILGSTAQCPEGDVPLQGHPGRERGPQVQL
jgi:hypothetical protein